MTSKVQALRETFDKLIDDMEQPAFKKKIRSDMHKVIDAYEQRLNGQEWNRGKYESHFQFIDYQHRRKLTENLPVLKALLDAQRIPYPDETQFQQMVECGKTSGYSLQSIRHRAMEHLDTLHKLYNKEVWPSRVVGKGYKNPYKVAAIWLQENIFEATYVLVHGFLSESVNLSNYHRHLELILKGKSVFENGQIFESSEAA